MPPRYASVIVRRVTAEPRRDPPTPSLSSAPLVPSLADVVDVHWSRGDAAPPNAAPSLLVEVAHGATAPADFERMAGLLDGPLPADLIDFFYVNTDRGAFEVAQAIARRFVAAAPASAALVVRSRVPRTFVDCNRFLAASDAQFREGGVPPGVMPWVRSARDQAFVRALHAAYVATVSAAMATLRADGLMLSMHTYAPREVGVTVAEDIVAQLHGAYEPDVLEGWPLRPAFDVISHDLDGAAHAPAGFVEALRARCTDLALACADSATYRLHPSTMGWHYAQHLPGRWACVEVRRDLLYRDGRFAAFADDPVDLDRADVLAAPIADALLGVASAATATAEAALR